METLHQAGAALADELARDFTDVAQIVRFTLRLLFALVLGGVLGWNREQMGKAAGLRTHMLVAAGAAVAVLAGDLAGMQGDALSRIIQGVLTGVGFIGGGVILKISEQQQIRGITTASGIWLTAAIGIAAGAGHLGLAVVSTVFALVVLGVLARVEQRLIPASGDKA
jgi:putative Mg2+ transporter-C (MgtC) family protein